MSVYGKIKKIEVLTLNEEISNLSGDDKGCESYIREKYETAEKNNRYVVKFHVQDPRFDKSSLSKVNAFVPKGAIDNKLIELDTYIECSSSSCYFKIAGVEDWFDRATNGATQIHDVRFKEPLHA